MESLKPYVILILAWAGYFFLHSIMATKWVKELGYKSGFTPRGYRLFYSVLSSILLFGLLLLNGLTEGPWLFPQHVFLKYAGLFFATAGLFVLRAAFKIYSAPAFLGLKPESSVLRREGILTYIRHPIYSATILISIGFVFFDPRLATLVSMMCVWAYLPIGIWLEENKLIREFGDAYRKYRREVPSVIPNLFKKR